MVLETPRRAMERTLKQVISAHLRPQGFTGTFPHLRRRLTDRIDLITFQFNRHGGSFVVELATCSPDGIITSWGKHISPGRVTAHDIPSGRVRIGGEQFPRGDHWYEFDTLGPLLQSGDVQPQSIYDSIALQVLDDIRRHGEPFFQVNGDISKFERAPQATRSSWPAKRVVGAVLIAFGVLLWILAIAPPENLFSALRHSPASGALQVLLDPSMRVVEMGLSMVCFATGLHWLDELGTKRAARIAALSPLLVMLAALQ